MKSYFVSSTFRDMQSERDAINQQVLPALKEFARQKGTDISIVDLRWGISTDNLDSDAGMKKILSVCMSEIDYCRPHMIVLLGDRYGSLPSEQTLQQFLKSSYGLAFLGADVAQKSVTELEIRYNLTQLRQQVPSRSEEIPLTICIRRQLPYDQMEEQERRIYQSCDETDARRLAELRTFLERNYPENILYYDAAWDAEQRCVTQLEQFVTALTERLNAQLTLELPEEPSTPEESQYTADRLLEERYNQVFSGRETYLNRIQAFLEDRISILLLKGQPGSGKSSLAVQIARTLRQNQQYNVISLYCGNGNYASSTSELLKNLTWRLELLLGRQTRFGAGEHAFGEWKAEAKRLLGELAVKGPVIVVVDALNLLRQDSNLQRFDFIPLPAKNLQNYQVILTATEEFVLPDHIIDNNTVYTIRVNPVTEEELAPMIASHLSYLRKELPENIRQLIFSAALYRTPLYLNLLMQRLNMLSGEDFARIEAEKTALSGGEDTLYRYIRQLISDLPGDEPTLAESLFQAAGTALGFPNFQLVLDITRTFAGGCRPEDYVGIFRAMGLQLSPLDLSVFVHYVGFLFTVDLEGRLRFSHQLIRFGAEPSHKMIDDSLRQAILRYLDTLPDEDPIKLWEYFHICFQSRHSKTASVYLSRIYQTCEKNSIQDDTEHYESLKTAIRTLRELLQPDSKGALDFFLRMCDAAAEESLECLYGFSSAIFFTYDLLFGPEMGVENTQSIMKRLHHHCLSTLYPARDRNLLYLRNVYVCCEQCGKRAHTYVEQLEYFEEFFRYCKELYEKTDDDYPHRSTILHDMSISYECLASLYLDRDFRFALELYDQAKYFTAQYAVSVAEKKTMAEYARQRIKELESLSARCILRKALRNQQIGWPMDEEMERQISSAREWLMGWQNYLLENPSVKNRLYYLAVCCVDITDYYRLIGEPAREREYTHQILKYARQDYQLCGELLSLDLMRNAYFRLGYEETFGYTLEERVKWMTKALDLAIRLRQRYGASNPITGRILSATLESLLQLRVALIQEQRAQHNGGDPFLLAEQYCAILSEVKDYMEELFSGNERERNYQMLMEFLTESDRLAQEQRIKAIRFHLQEDHSQAIQNGQCAIRLQELIGGFTNSVSWVAKMLDLCNLLRICYHNRRLDSGNSGEDQTREMVLIRQCLYYAKQYTVRGGKDGAILRVAEGLALYELPQLRSWLQFAAVCFTEGKEEQFWTLAWPARLEFPGQKTAYLYLYSQDDLVKLRQWARQVGSYFCARLTQPRVLEFLECSDFFEAVCLEYAYQNGLEREARCIVENGYQNYLELPLLYILRRYDRKEYLKRLHQLKSICLKKRKKEIKNATDILGPVFCTEFMELYQEIQQTKMQKKEND